jgi:hypothetical protein
MTTETKPPTLQLVPRPRAKPAARANRFAPHGETEDVRAWGQLCDAFEGALRLNLSRHTRERMLRSRSLITLLARRSPVREVGGDA